MGVVLGAEVGAVVVLHRLGSAAGFGLPGADVGQWVHDTPAVDVVAALMRLVALAGAWWLLASTVLWLVLRLGGTSARGIRHLRALEPFALPGVRCLVDATLALGVVGAALVPGTASFATSAPAPGTPGPTTATTTPVLILDHSDHRAAGATPPETVRTGRAQLAQTPATPTTTGAPTTTTTTTTAVRSSAEPEPLVPAPAAPAPTPPPAAPAPLPRTHVVAPGENLWVIAAAEVGAATNRPPSSLPAADVAPYWSALCAANRATLRSGNPSLIYAGEVVTLPEL